MLRRMWVAVIASVTALGSAPRARAADDDAKPRSSLFQPARDPNRPRSTIGIPLVSFLLPGFDQWWEGQYGSAALYTGAAIGGYAYTANVARHNGYLASGARDENRNGKADKDEDGYVEDEEKDEDSLDAKDVTIRKMTLGGLVAQGAGGLSAYHSFRTAVRTHKAQGGFDFLVYEETPADILLAPFHFQYLARPTTFIPLAIGAGIMALVLSSDPGDEMERAVFTGADGFFTTAYSFNAGTHEEAMFRGWIMPVMYEAWDSAFWTNAAQAVLFAAAHLPTNPAPLPQLLLGYHLGNVTMKNQWRIGESVFIHVWWDVLAFAGAYHYKQKKDDEEASSTDGRLRVAAAPVLWLPPLQFHF